MPQRWSKILLPLLAIPILFAACKKQFSSDQALAPVYIPSIIINSDDQILYGINPATGLANWQFSLPITLGTPCLPISFQPSPLLYKEKIYIPVTQNSCGLPDTIYKINSETGSLVSKFVFDPGVLNANVQATLIAAGNLIYIASTNDTLYAIDTGTGKTQWKYNAGAPMISSPTLYNGYVFCATTGGVVFALKQTQSPATTGGLITDVYWTSTTGGSFYSSPAISSPYLFVGSAGDSNMYCIPLYTGTVVGTSVTPKWTFKTNGAIYSSPTISPNGACIFGSTDNNVYSVDTQTDIKIWNTATRSQIRSSPVIVDGVVYIGSYDYNLYALNIIDGSVKWTFGTRALIKSSPLVYGGTVYIGSYDDFLYAVDTGSGTIKWNYYTAGQIECSPVVDDLSGTDQINSQVSGYTN